MNDITEIERFIKKASIKIESFKEAKNLYAEKIAPDFNIFDFLRDDEMGLSKCIANLLNPEGKHSQGNKFLNLFIIKIQQTINDHQESVENNNFDKVIESINQNFSWSAMDRTHCTVELEHSTNEQRRIDIHLEFHSGEMIGIENKPWAGDQRNQLSDYAKYLKDKSLGRNWLLIYLCNSQPSEDSISKNELEKLISNGNMLILSYQALVEWLEECVNVTKAPVVRVFIEELITFVKKEINGETDMVLAGQLSKVIQENLDTSMQIAASIDEVKKSIIKQLKHDLQEMAIKENYKLQWKDTFDAKWPSYTGFGFNLNQTDTFEVWFEFAQPNLKGFYWGIRKKDKDIKKDESLWKEINNVMTSKFGTAKSTAWWPCYYFFEDNYKHWENNPKPWLDIQNGVIAEEIVYKVKSVYDHLEMQNRLGLLKGQI